VTLRIIVGRMSMLSRRHFLTSLAASAQVFVSARYLFATTPPAAAARQSRALSFTHTHTGERLSIEYFSAGSFVDDALLTVNHFLRDFRTGDVHAIDPQLLDLLHSIAAMTETSRPFQVISGYRSPATNEMLRQHSEGVASNSLHMQGQAIDIRLADVPLAKLRRAALDVRRGGVGYYPASDFVHVDTGRVRFW
jgi:uncharacterized protein YcbK (DUF882 family)